ncbi:MAG TPA: HAD family hydrolase [Chloroflexota bacterium]|jgi:P-type E1-E2 ATPase
MITLVIPGAGEYRIHHLLLDVNGTISLDGEPLEGVAERLARLREQVMVELVSADSRGQLGPTAQALGTGSCRVEAGSPEAEQKAARVRALGAESVAAIGNGANDAGMVQAAAVGIAVLGPEGLSTCTLHAADLVAPSILAALDLLLHPHRLASTLEC